MNGLTNFLERKFVPIATKIGSQRHLVAIRDAFIAIMPVTMAGSFAVLLNVFFRDIPNEFNATRFVEMMTPIISIDGNVWWGTIAIFSLVFVFSLGYHLSLAYDVNPVAGAMIAFASYIATLPQSYGEQWGAFGVSYMNATALFSALLVGFVSTIIYAKLTQANIVIKMPEGVPPAVSKAFLSIIPGVVSIFFFAIVSFLLNEWTGKYLNDLIVEYVQTPFLALSQGLISVLVITLFIQIFWFFGMHGTNVLAPLLDGVYKTALGENTAAYELGKRGLALPHVWTRGSFNAYTNMGGAGVTFSLIIAIFFFSKKESERTVAKLSLPMGVFNINEPVIFGLPIVLNLFYLIPFVIIPPILAAVAYLFTISGLIPPVAIEIPWIVPPVLNAFLGTGGSLMAAAVALLNLVIATFIWAIFVRIASNAEIKE